ncbi:MAG: DUF3306 domain-containing protein [Pseudomonadota bacterium]
MAEEPGGFLGRWAQRKTQVLQGKSLDEPVLAAKPGPDDLWVVPPANPAEPMAATAAPPANQLTPAEKVLSLDDAKLLTKDSDFKPFMARGVGSAVRNAAMKKLFADPHFNVMDGLDTYIDDYSIPDPIPEAMLREMNGSKFLKLFDDVPDKDHEAAGNIVASSGESANNTTDQTVAQSCESLDTASSGSVVSDNPSQTVPVPELPGPAASQKDHANTDLRLQPDHAAPAPRAGRSA